MSRYVGAIDQGTTSTRFMVFDEGARQKAVERSLGWLGQPHLNDQSDPAV